MTILLRSVLHRKVFLIKGQEATGIDVLMTYFFHKIKKKMIFLTTHIRIDLTYVHDHQGSALNLIKKTYLDK